ncbi:DUF748 domain-containing protein [Salinisphaera aquimarina]|uniref:DUF748 domain-containing protein n=1 Tax=Salinisphaera aquimarina TaxID=2094031 RepID=A0ABV7EX92_9GAMM
MTLTRGPRRLLIALVVVALVCAGLILGAPLIARELTLHYLAQAGVDARIGNVDINLFTGTIEYDDIEGHSSAGDGFEIGHLATAIDYPPLLSRQISLSRLAIDDAAIDVRRTADNTLRVGGIPVLSGQNDSGGGLNWGLALQQLSVGALRLHYSQPADGDAPAIDRELVFNDSSARDIVTWQQDNDVPLDANLSVGDGRIGIKGRITPFGQKISAHFEFVAENFALDLLSPITRSNGLKSLTGAIDGQQQIDMEYSAAAGLSLKMEGNAGWQDSRMELADGASFSSDRFDWQGTLTMHLIGGRDKADAATAAVSSSDAGSTQPTGKPRSDESPAPSKDSVGKTVQINGMRLRLSGSTSLVGIDALPGPAEPQQTVTVGDEAPTRIDIDGHIQTDGLRTNWPDLFSLDQKHADWQGTLQARLGGAASRITTDSTLKARAASFSVTGGTHIRADTLDWHGTTTTALADTTRVDSDGTLKAKATQIAVAEGASVGSASLNFKGSTRTIVDNNGTRVDAHGALSAQRMKIAERQGTVVDADTLTFDGDTHVTTGDASTRVDADGALAANGMRLAVPDSIDFVSDTLNFKGTSRTDIDAGSTRVHTDGALDASAFAFTVVDTSTFSADDLDWQGTTTVDMAQLFARQGHGRLIANGARLDIAATPIALSADRLVYDGDYAETANGAGDALVLRMAGEIDGHEFAVMNTAIDAPWVDMMQMHGSGLSIDGLDSIALDAIEAHGVRMLGDTDSSVAVVESVTTTAQQFRLDDLLHYRVAKLDLQGTNIHLRRDAGGMGVIAQFFGDDATDESTGPSSDASSSSASYTVDNLALSGPALTFTDVTVEPPVVINGADVNLAVNDLDTADPDRDADYRLSLDVGAYGHLDSRGKIAPMATGGVNMNLDAWLRSLAMRPLSGYLNAAMGRRIANGAADGTLHLEATAGQLNGNLDTTLANFRLVDNAGKPTNVALGVSLDTALALVRGQDDVINFQTLILGDATNPYFSVKNLVREAVLAGLRTAIMSDYSPLGLLNKAKNALFNLGRSLISKPVAFEPGKHYVRPDDRPYLGHIAQAMKDKPGIAITVQGHAVPADADAMSLFHGPEVDSDNRVDLQNLARQRGGAVRDYLAARGVNPDRITLAEPVVDRGAEAKAQATFSMSGR